MATRHLRPLSAEIQVGIEHFDFTFNMYFIHEQEQVTQHAADHKTTTQEVMCVVLEPFDGREPPILHVVEEKTTIQEVMYVVQATFVGKVPCTTFNTYMQLWIHGGAGARASLLPR